MKIHALDTGSVTTWDNINLITIYGNGKILFQTENHKLTQFRENKNGEFKDVYDGDILTLHLSTEPVRAIKENLNRKDNYFRKHSTGTGSWNVGTALYIHESEITVVSLGEKLAMATTDQKNYLNAFHFTFVHGAEVRRLHAERVPNAGKGWTIPDGGRWSNCYGSAEKPCYDTFTPHDGGEIQVIKRWSTLEKINEMDTASRYYCRTEYSDEYKKCRRIADFCNENRIFYGHTISAYDIQKFMKHFNVEEKTV